MTTALFIMTLIDTMDHDDLYYHEMYPAYEELVDRLSDRESFIVFELLDEGHFYF